MNHSIDSNPTRSEIVCLMLLLFKSFGPVRFNNYFFIFVFRYDALHLSNGTEKTFMLQNIYISNKLCSIEDFRHQRVLK